MAIDCSCPPQGFEWENSSRQVEEADDYAYLPLLREIDDYIVVLDAREFAKDEGLGPATEKSLKEAFLDLAHRWEDETRGMSSVTGISSTPSYQKIVALGWEVVPHLLNDLKTNQRFWFPALFQITGVRPFDRSEAGDSKRMLNSWITWGKRKGLI